MYGFQEFGARGGGAIPCVLCVVSPNSLRGCLKFWNLRAIRSLNFNLSPVIVVPYPGFHNWKGFERQLADVLRRPLTLEPDVVVAGSVGAKKLHRVARKLGLVESSEPLKFTESWPPPDPKEPPHSYRVNINPKQFFVFERIYGKPVDVLVQLHERVSELRVDNPVRSRGGAATLRMWSPALTYLPRRDHIAKMVHPGAQWLANGLGVRVAAHASEFSVDLMLPDIQSVVAALLDSLVSNHDLSDKGVLAAGLESTEFRSVVLEEGVLGAVQFLFTPRSDRLARELGDLNLAGADLDKLADLASRWGGRSERRFRSATELMGAKLNIIEGAERMASVGLVERGLQVKCGGCRHKSFIELSAVVPQARCPACRSLGEYSLSNRKLEIFYRLNSMVDTGWDQGVIAHVLGVVHMRTLFEDISLQLGTNIVLKSGEKAEVDFLGIADGVVVFGEAKASSKEFTEEQIDRDLRIASELEAEIYLVVSLDDVAIDVVQRIEKRCEEAGMRLALAEGGRISLGGKIKDDPLA